jgi:DNA integrity scanning protein DisA with diadenylate cyclase activity/mannitol/fructose-specific phosphotransferase system IIA component (Ntr-type)
MELRELVDAAVIVEITATTRSEAIRQMVEAVQWSGSSLGVSDIVDAIEQREAAAQTVVAGGFALPHAVIDWNGPFRIVLGRSRAGVNYGIPGAAPIHLIALLVVGQPYRNRHLDLLSAVAELLQSREFRDALVVAADVASIDRLVRHQVGVEPEVRPRRITGIAQQNQTIVGQAVQLVEAVEAQALLLAVDHSANVPWDQLINWEGRLLVVTSDPSDELPYQRADTHLFDIPHRGLAGTNRANLGLLMAAASGLLDRSPSVVCVTGSRGSQLDSVTVAKPEGQFHRILAEHTSRRQRVIRPAVILRVVSLAIELAHEGREGRSVGTMFVVGDSRQVMRYAQQLVLNPFHGYGRSLRSVLDPSLAETIKEFAQIDGAFIIQSDGTVLSAGTFLAPQVSVTGLPAGLGARHTTAAAISSQTRAVAIAVSQSTGTVTLFHHGTIVMTLERATQTRW